MGLRRPIGIRAGRLAESAREMVEWPEALATPFAVAESLWPGMPRSYAVSPSDTEAIPALRRQTGSGIASPLEVLDGSRKGTTAAGAGPRTHASSLGQSRLAPAVPRPP